MEVLAWAGCSFIWRTLVWGSKLVNKVAVEMTFLLEQCLVERMPWLSLTLSTVVRIHLIRGSTKEEARMGNYLSSPHNNIADLSMEVRAKEGVRMAMLLMVLLWTNFNSRNVVVHGGKSQVASHQIASPQQFSADYAQASTRPPRSIKSASFCRYGCYSCYQIFVGGSFDADSLGGRRWCCCL
ncbi:conserved hypothetical protein [Ricinus communis]|uniref:Uncharacterized protein n=1 Tax=Ricinus communis TaxID=3988 RepID=B9SIU4_RICCO|nr:conserved hypothetical protein [Ricinus communis]